MKVAVIMKFSTILLVLGFLTALPAARADESNQATKVTFSQPIQIPGRVLPAGTYWFMLPESDTEHDQVRIYNADQTVYYGTLLTINAVRRQTTEKSAFTFSAHDSTQPQALISWFYPGETSGHQFLYPKRESKELAKTKQVSVVAGD